jgi:hypothetical protein
MFRKNEREYLKGKTNELETNNKNKNIRYFYRCRNEFNKGTNRNLRYFYREINEFNKGCQPRIITIKDENDKLLANPRSVWS